MPGGNLEYLVLIIWILFNPIMSRYILYNSVAVRAMKFSFHSTLTVVRKGYILSRNYLHGKISEISKHLKDVKKKLL